METLYDIMISNCLVDVNKENPERTGKYAFTVARYSISYFTVSMSDIGDAILKIIAAAHDMKVWVKNSLQNNAWVSTTTMPSISQSETKILIIVHCDDDTDAMLTKLTHGDLPPVIEL